MATTVEALYRPLTGWVKEKKVRFRLGPWPVIALWVGFAAAVAAWLLLVKDPLGGEPVVRQALPALVVDAETASAPADHTEEASAGQEAARPNPTGTESEAQQVKIITPGGANGQGQIRIVDLGATAGNRALRAAPEPRLVEKGRYGLLPRIGADGSRPSAFYARPFDPSASNLSSAAPRIAILVGGLGISSTLTGEAIAKLPPEVTFAFAPYGGGLQGLVNKARGDGHEVMLHMPMEPFDFPSNDPGPQTLLTTLSPEQNLDRLYWAMTRFSGYTGLTNYMGAKFVTNNASLKFLFAELKRRGLTYIDDGAAARSVVGDVARQVGLSYRSGSVTIDAVPTPQRIDEALANLEIEAEQRGSAIGVASALPVSIERLARWAKAIERKGFVLVPVSAVIDIKK